MRSILIVAAGLLQLTYGSVLPRSGAMNGVGPYQGRHQRLAVRAVGVFADGKTPKLVHDGTTILIKEGEILEMTEPDRAGFVENTPILDYELSSQPDNMTIALVKPAQSIKKRPASAGCAEENKGPQTVAGKAQNGAVTTEHEIVGTFDQPSSFIPGQHRERLAEFANGTAIPDGTFHIAMVTFSRRAQGTARFVTFISPQFEVRHKVPLDIDIRSIGRK